MWCFHFVTLSTVDKSPFVRVIMTLFILTIYVYYVIIMIIGGGIVIDAFNTYFLNMTLVDVAVIFIIFVILIVVIRKYK